MRKSKLAKILYKIKIKILIAASKFHKTGAAQCTGLKLTAVDNFRKTTVVLKNKVTSLYCKNIFWLWFNWQSKQ